MTGGGLEGAHGDGGIPMSRNRDRVKKSRYSVRNNQDGL